MKYIIRTVEEGQRISIVRLEEKKTAVRDKIISAGFDCLEYDAFLRTVDALGETIEEQVTTIEAVTGQNYV